MVVYNKGKNVLSIAVFYPSSPENQRREQTTYIVRPGEGVDLTILDLCPENEIPTFKPEAEILNLFKLYKENETNEH